MSEGDPKNQQLDSVKSSNISCSRESCKRWWCNFNSYWRMAYVFFVVFYLLIGGATFSAVERPNELRQIEETERARADAIDSLAQMLMNLTNLTEAEVLNLTTSIIQLGEIASTTLPAEQSPIWDFASAFFFASTVVTTIGYGTIAPSTAAGQILFIFYAIIGIPLALVSLSQIGTIIDKWINHVLRPIERRWGSTASRSVGIVFLFLITISFFILIPGAIYTKIETWNYRESVYYTIVTLTTVGFGDFVPAQSGTNTTNAVTGLYKILSSVWLWIGLALVSALISEVQGTIEGMGKWCHANHCHRLKKRLKKRFDNKELKVMEPITLTEAIPKLINDDVDV